MQLAFLGAKTIMHQRLRLNIMWFVANMRRARDLFFLLFDFLITSHDFHRLLNLLPLALLILAPTNLPLQRPPPTSTPPTLREEIIQSGDLVQLTYSLSQFAFHMHFHSYHDRLQTFFIRISCLQTCSQTPRTCSLLPCTEAPISCVTCILIKLLIKSIQNSASDRQTVLPSLASKTA